MAGDTQPDLDAAAAANLIDEAKRLADQGLVDEAFAAYARVAATPVGTSGGLAREVARALVNAGAHANEQQEFTRELGFYEDVLRRFGDSTDPMVQSMVAAALNGRGATFLEQDRVDDAVDAFDEVQNRFESSTDNELGIELAVALAMKTAAWLMLEQPQAARATADRATRSLRELDTSQALEERVGILRNLGDAYSDLEDHEAAIAAYDELLATARDSTEPGIVTEAVVAASSKSVQLVLTDRGDDALASCESALEWALERVEPGDCPELAEIRLRIAAHLESRDRTEDSFAQYDEVIATYRDSTGLAANRYVATALESKAWLVFARRIKRQALPLFEEAIERFEHDPDGRWDAARTRCGLAMAIALTGKKRAAKRCVRIAEEVLSEVGDPGSPEQREVFECALVAKAIGQLRSGDRAGAADTCRMATRRLPAEEALPGFRESLDRLRDELELT